MNQIKAKNYSVLLKLNHSINIQIQKILKESSDLDTLFKISQNYNKTISEIMKLSETFQTTNKDKPSEFAINEIIRKDEVALELATQLMNRLNELESNDL